MKINTKYVVLVVLALFQFCATGKENRQLTQHNASLYHGGNIITMEGDTLSYVDALVEQDGKVVYVGSKQGAEKAYSHARIVNLNGKTLMPGFIEPHLHPSIAALMLPNNTIAPHQWKKPNGISKATKTPEAFKHQLKASIANAPENKMHFIWGYHQLWHGELSRDLLNQYSGDNKPVGIIHRSFHEIYLNDAAIKLFNIAENDFANNPQVNWQKGHFYEGGWLALVPKIGSVLLDPVNYQKGLSMMTELMLQNGITTIAEPGFPSADFKMEYAFLKNEMDKQPPYDIYLIPNGTQLYGMAGNSNEKAEKQMQGLAEAYDTDNIFFLPQQVKLFADGAIYSLAMQMNEPYLGNEFHGEWMTPLQLFQQQLSFYWSKGYKIHVHANGDKGIQQVVDFNKADQKAHPRENHRFTLHHMGYFDAKIAEQINSLNIEASVNPFYLWALADKYSENGLGPQRAENLVRVKELTKRNIPVSFHSDFAMAPAEPLTLAWTAINRVTSENSAFSQDQRLDIYTAMKGITIDAARTLNLEDKIGSIKVGKVANFTILKENPFTVDPMKIKDIPVAAVVYKGKWVQNKH
ncbi:N-substituted formamide deformylase precursor [Pseudoalteromonas sp. P1-9]|uniref:amidohydrolase n=1 Tax=Pseudoalteromonas sp. P1-9 TaxID=1710354 RepID=UPI0006D5F129|nr:amidohydrolase [Pseudoalteromonas sp. P1-9]KPV95865.1 N-substituted formamide deformylase precursor [Pseudoalteromonas sp. P1-9]